ncbi:MAG: hypothetical protein Q6373_004135, partial [Candidatus Sigynarchaeota archaeon]
MEELARAIYAPGQIGKDFGTTRACISPSDFAARVFVLIALPALGFGWVLLYALTGPTSFGLTLQYGVTVNFDFITMPPFLLVPLLAGFVAGAFWFFPTALFF